MSDVHVCTDVPTLHGTSMAQLEADFTVLEDPPPVKSQYLLYMDSM